jgi:ferredoxin
MPCPYGIDIPGILLHFNKCINEDRMPVSSMDDNYRELRREYLIGYDRSVPKLRQADHCIGCNQCVKKCPQRINIPKQMRRIDKFVEALKDVRKAEKVDAALRTVWLHDKYRLRADYIHKLNTEYGSMDWRLPEAQAIYWASEGIRRSGQHNMQCSRIIATCLQEMMRAGRVLWNEQDGYRYLILAPNLDIVQAAIRTYDWAYDEAQGLESFRTGKINFMKNAAVMLFIFGRYDETKTVYEQLKADDNTVKYPPFKTFLDKELKEIVENSTFKQITDIINAFIQNSLNAVVNDNEEAAATYEVMAQKIWLDYQKTITSDKERERRGLAPYSEIRNQVVKDYLNHADPRAAQIIRAKLGTRAAERAAGDDAAAPATRK